MPSSRIPSPARSQGVISTPRKHTPRRSRSVCSARSSMSMRLTAIISDSFKLSPMPKRQSVLNDDTNIEIPSRKSWWKKLGENSRDVMEVLESNAIAEVNNVAEEFDVEILSQEKKNYTLDLPESSDGESINSIVIPQRKLFTQKDTQTQKKFGHLIDNRETLAKLQKSHFDQEKDINIAPKNLFSQASKTRTKPAFPAALLNISSKTLNKTKEMPTAEVKGQVRNLFGNRPGMKRKNMFTDFIVSDSEDEIPDIQPKVFGFQKNTQKRRESTASRGVGHSPTSSIDLELDEWKLLPSSTMVENQLEEATTPVKRARLSKLSEAKESETTNVNSTVNKTRQSNKSLNSKNKSKTTSNSKLKENIEEDLNQMTKTKDLIVTQNNQSLNSSSNVRLTRNKSKSIRESSIKEGDQSRLNNKSKNTSQSKQNISAKTLVNEKDKNTNQVEKITEATSIQNKDEIKNASTEDVPTDNDEDFTLEYENDDEPNIEPTNTDTNNGEKNNTIHNKTNNAVSNKTSKVNPIKNMINENSDIVDAGIETGSKEILTEINEDVRETQMNEHEQDNVDTTQIEKQERNNKKLDLHQSLVKNSDKIQNKSKHEEEINQSKNTTKYKKNNLNDKNDTRQTTHKDAPIENKIDSEHLHKDENITKVIENEKQNETENKDDDNEIQNESAHTSIHEQEDRNECIDEASMEVEEEHEQTQNESHETDNETKEQTGEDNIEYEIENQIDQDEIEHEADDQDEVENETEDHTDQDKIEHDTEDQDEVENETEDRTDQDVSEVIDSDNQEQNDIESSENETEEQQNESIEANEEGDESEEEEQNETENQDESENADDSDSQNESNLSLNENEQEDDAIELDQKLSDNDVEDNEVPEDEVANETSTHHDTTGRYRKTDVTIKSPEAILHDKTNQIESFTAQGRNTSVRKTKSIIRNLNIRPSLAPVRESTGISDGTRDSSAEGSGWDSHRTTRKTIRLTLGKDFTPRKSLRALVMEKSAKRNTNFNEVTTKIPQANSTELPAFDSYQEPDPVEVDETIDEPSEHEVSARTRQTTLEMYLQKIKHENLERKRKMEEEIRASLKAPVRDTFNSFKMPLKPVRRVKPIQSKPKTMQIKSSVIPIDMLPSEVLEDMKYKPPKRFQPSNASWITKRLYKFLESKLEPKYDYKARVRAERLVELLYGFTREVKRAPNEHAVDTLKREMARLDIVKTHFDFYQFFHEFMPREIRVKVVPDVVNKISLPRNGVFSDIIQ